MINYTWNILQVSTFPEKAGKNNVVHRVTFSVFGIDDVGHSASKRDIIDLELNESESFTPFEQLTQQQVIEWVKDSLTPAGVKEIETTISTAINNQLNPSAISPALPWADVSANRTDK